MRKSVIIDFLPESVQRYKPDWTIVAVDVIRATTTAITAAASGRRCFPVPTVKAALALADQLDGAVLAGESGGKMPERFEMDNSPTELLARKDINRPLVLVSSSGTRVIHEAARCAGTYLGSFRNYSALPDHLAGHHRRIAIIGAGSLGEFREEDQICCAWIAAGLLRRGYVLEDAKTVECVSRWRDSRADACLSSRSVDFLKRTGRVADLEFIMSHIDDLHSVFAVHNGEVEMAAQAESLAAVAEEY